MARLPEPGGDEGSWGEILNEYLTVAHNSDGTLKHNGALASKYTKPTNGIPMSDLALAVQQAINNAAGADGQDGVDGRNVQFQANATHIQWRYVGDAAWTDLVALATITGPPGSQGPQGLAGTDGADGADGSQGPQGLPGADGSDGRSAYQIAVDEGFVGDETAWLASLQGAQGVQGEQGLPGADGPQGAAGQDGADGVGVPVGGATGQVLAKSSGVDYDTDWVDQPSVNVDSVNGQTGAVVLSQADVGLANVDNTSDENKPISTATQNVLDGKADVNYRYWNGTSGVGTWGPRPNVPAGRHVDAYSVTDQLAPAPPDAIAGDIWFRHPDAV